MDCRPPLPALLALLALPLPAVVLAQVAAAPSSADAEFWHSAERIGSADAFKAYLKAFPQGVYADLARAAISKADAAPAPAATANAPSATGLAQDPAKLLAGTPTAGAITMMPGETYYGPGPITVGYLGAKKQLVIPTGPWVLVAVADRNSGHSTPVPLVSMVFAQFREGRLQSLLSYLFNGRAGAGSRSWTDADNCLKSNPPRDGQKLTASQGADQGCGWTVRQTTPPRIDDAGWEQAQAVVRRLGAPVPATPLQYTRAWVTDRGANYVAIRRTDYDVREQRADAGAVQTARLAWLHDYLPLMVDGLQKRLGASELDPDQPQPPKIRLTLSD